MLMVAAWHSIIRCLQLVAIKVSGRRFARDICILRVFCHLCMSSLAAGIGCFSALLL